MSTWLTDYFGEQLLTREGLKPTSEVMQGKTRIAIYFSAHWCPPCRAFTPMLAEFYEQLSEEDPSSLQIVFVSSDRDEASFNEYYGTMPWVALPLSNSSAKQSLASKFGVRGIPYLVVLDSSDGSVKDQDARSTVVSVQGDTAKAIAQWA
mmetsp:Transcript_9655/g.16099  ORF Transcript_9655/g.16099 Transcript_9655/m.16099 type:complete len:150 (+) Transcript_9655:64-513(+)